MGKRRDSLKNAKCIIYIEAPRIKQEEENLGETKSVKKMGINPRCWWNDKNAIHIRGWKGGQIPREKADNLRGAFVIQHFFHAAKCECIILAYLFAGGWTVVVWENKTPLHFNVALGKFDSILFSSLGGIRAERQSFGSRYSFGHKFEFISPTAVTFPRLRLWILIWIFYVNCIII